MERKTKSRLLIGGLVVFSALIALYTYWVFLSSANPTQDWQAFLLNVSTELIGALIVFFFFNLFFFLDDWDLSERVAQLLNRLDRERPKAEKFFQKLPDIGPMIQEADAIDLCGVSLTSTINRHFTLLRDSLAEGTPVRLLIIDPRSTAVEMANARSESQDIEYYRKRLDASLSDIGYLWEKQEGFVNEGNAGAFEIRLLPYAPSFGLQIFRRARSKGQMNVEIYPHHGGYGAPPIFTLDESDDSLWYAYFQDQFEDMWARAAEWSPEMLQKEDSRHKMLFSSARAQDFFFENNPDLKPYLQNAEEIYLYGIDLGGTISFHIYLLRQCLERSNGSIKVLIASQDQFEARQEESLKRLEALSLEPTINGKIEVREFPGKTHFALIATNPHRANCRLQMRYYLPAWKNKNTPKFEIFRERDEYWTNFFLNQFEEAWQQSTVKVSNVNHPSDGKVNSEIGATD